MFLSEIYPAVSQHLYLYLFIYFFQTREAVTAEVVRAKTRDHPRQTANSLTVAIIIKGEAKSRAQITGGARAYMVEGGFRAWFPEQLQPPTKVEAAIFPAIQAISTRSIWMDLQATEKLYPSHNL